MRYRQQSPMVLTAWSVCSRRVEENAAVTNFDEMTAHVQFGVETAPVFEREFVGVKWTDHRIEL